nr:leucine-rich repeat and calponin homology domain-containing protein 1 isoform X6 [Chrysemys picta bellii]
MFSYGLPWRYYPIPGSGGLVRCSRYERCILSHRHLPGPPAFPALHHQPTPFPIYGLALRPSNGPVSVHEMHVRGGSLSSEKKDAGIPVLGRLAPRGQVRGRGPLPCGTGVTAVPQARSTSQCTQVLTEPHAETGFHRSGPGLGGGTGKSSSVTVPGHSKGCKLHPTIPHDHGQMLYATLGAHGGLHTCSQTCPPKTQTITLVAGPNVSPQQRPLRPTSDNPSSDVELPPLVARSAAGLRRVPFATPQPTLTLVTDAADLGWGAHLGDLWTLGLWSREEKLLHINLKELRAVRLTCQTFHATIEGHSMSVLTDNTTAMFYINKQGGSQSSPLCHEALLLWDFCIAHSVHLLAAYLPGVQNRLAVRLNRSYHMHEWTLQEDVLHSNSRGGGFPRWISSPPRTTANALSFVHSRTSARAHWQMPSRFRGGETEVCLPTIPAHPQGPAQDPQGQGDSHPHRTGVAMPALVHDPAGTILDHPDRPPPPSRPHHAGPGSPTPPEPTVTTSHGVVSLWLNDTEHKCSHQVQQILLGSRKPSTRATYLAKWKRFSHWCEPHHIRPLQASIPSILDYLLHLKHQGLAPASIKMHLATVSAGVSLLAPTSPCMES